MKAPSALLMSAVLSAGALLAASGDARAQDAAAGQKVYAQCRACHSLDAGKNGLGPSLKGVIGRKAASADGFKTYSPAMQKSGIVWTEDNIKKYLADPKGFIPGNRMVYAGLKRPADVENVIAYIKQESAK
jgi:cytochrome c